MEITWYGHSCFRIVERGNATIVTDPFSEKIGYGPLNLKADVVTVSHNSPGHANIDAIKNWKFAITSPGEYEIGEVFIIGTAMTDKNAEVPRQNVLYLFDYGSLNVVHLGDLSHVPSQSALESLGEVHVLMVPVGGGGGLSASQAAELVAMLEPNLVIPMHFATPASRVDLTSVDKFLTEMGVTSIEAQDSLKISASSLPETTQVVLLNYKLQDAT